jgi:hypothetical protein
MGVTYVSSLPSLGWSEGRIETELREYLAGKAVWPSWAEFEGDGRRALRTAVRSTGGAYRWAGKLKVALPDTRREARRWSYEELKSGIEQVATSNGLFPARCEFSATGYQLLYDAMMRLRLRSALAADLGLELPSGRVSANFRWTELAIRHSLDGFLVGRTVWPGDSEFRRAGLGGMLSAVRRDGTVAAWARQYELKLPNHWTGEAIRVALDELVTGRRYWPTRASFYDSNLAGLYTLLMKTRTMETWRDEYGLATAPRRWTDERIAARLTELLDGEETWPLARDPRFHPLHQHLMHVGTRNDWARRFGFEPPSPGRIGRRR